MKTDDLIRALAADDKTQNWPLAATLGLALAAGFAVSAVLFAAVYGPRPDIADAAATWRFMLKPVETLLLAAVSVALVLQLVRPGVPRQMWLFAIPAALAAAAIGLELTSVPQRDWTSRLIGHNALICLTAIPLMSLAPLGAILFALRQGAPTRPAVTGMVAGLLAGGTAATLYAMHCTDDSPLFVATWYTIAVAAMAGIGALAGARVLRW